MRAENWIVGAINLERAGFGSSTAARTDVPSYVRLWRGPYILDNGANLLSSSTVVYILSRNHSGHSYINEIRLIKGFMQDRGKNRQFVNCAVTPEPWNWTGLV